MDIYAELLKHREAGDLTRKGEVEQAVADTSLPVIAGLDSKDPYWRASAVLRKALVHHLDEEEKERFLTARKVLDSQTAAVLGPQMDRQREALLGE